MEKRTTIVDDEEIRDTIINGSNVETISISALSHQLMIQAGTLTHN